ncbi:kelch repeat-containing protein [Burkholderia ubonensis]|uniref:kelch repeat-containing protein n=1 Tax=Burkholderia ubonensis TaxID=101571 RepID=UPI0012FAD3E6|nr:kelch repeat-containing protein [Burkholderia ubonensis]
MAFVRAGRAGLLYSIGGDNCTASANNPVGALTLVDAYDENNNVWVSGMAPLPQPRTRLTAVSLGQWVVAFGGMDSTGQPASDIFMYDANANTWTTSSLKLSVPRYDLKAAVGQDGNIYVAGGRTSASQPVGLVEKFVPTANLAGILNLSSGGMAPNLNTPRSAFAFARAANGRLYAAGGYTGVDRTGTIANSIESYNPDKGETVWTTESTLLEYPVAAAASSSTQEGDIVIIGGVTASGETKSAQHIIPVAKSGDANSIHNLTFYLHGQNEPPDYGGLLMTKIPPVYNFPIGFGVLSSARWDSYPTLVGNISNSSASLTLPCPVVGLGTLTLEATQLDGSAPLQIGSASVVNACAIGQSSLTIPFALKAPSFLLFNELRLTINTLVGLKMGSGPITLTINGYDGLPDSRTAVFGPIEVAGYIGPN